MDINHEQSKLHILVSPSFLTQQGRLLSLNKFIDKYSLISLNFYILSMECLIGIQGADFTIIASDTNAARSIVTMKKGRTNQKKMYRFKKKVTNRSMLMGTHS